MKDSKKISEQNKYRQADETEINALRQALNGEAKELFDHILHGGTAAVYLSRELPLYFISEPLLNEMGISRSQFMKQYHGSFLETLHPDEQGDYIEELNESMRQGKLFEKVCRARIKDCYCYVRDLAKYVQVEEGLSIVLILRCNVSDIKAYHQELKQKDFIYETRNNELETLTANIPGGFCIVKADDRYTLIYGNEGFYMQTGYSKEQFMCEKNNSVLSVIYEKDLKNVIDTFKEVIMKGGTDIQYEYRFVKRNGEIIWCLMKGQISYDKEIPELRCLIMDITDRKKIEVDAKMSEERFRIALAQTDNTIFEYDIKAKLMIHGDRSAESYGLKQYTDNVPDSLLEQEVVHPDSANDFLGMYDEIRSGSKNASCLVLARLNTGVYVWRKIMMTSIFDENGTPVQAVGVLENVDEQVRREAELRRQMEKDILTGLYSRGAVIEKIRHELESREPNMFQALAVIDYDDFKSVNDNYGHMFGDFVLSEGAERIMKLLEEHDFAGRIGGDEFLAFFSRLGGEDEARQWAQKIVDCFQSAFCDRGKEARVTCSAGIALCPGGGDTFEDLYQNADQALYTAKSKGKHQVVVYERQAE